MVLEPYGLTLLTDRQENGKVLKNIADVEHEYLTLVKENSRERKEEEEIACRMSKKQLVCFAQSL